MVWPQACARAGHVTSRSGSFVVLINAGSAVNSHYSFLKAVIMKVKSHVKVCRAMANFNTSALLGQMRRDIRVGLATHTHVQAPALRHFVLLEYKNHTAVVVVSCSRVVTNYYKSI